MGFHTSIFIYFPAKMITMLKLKGRVESGVHRGAPLIEAYFFRLIGILGFEPFKGTLNVALDRAIDIGSYSTKNISHVLMDGTTEVYAYLAPVVLGVKGQDYECWVICSPEHSICDDIEIVAKDNLHEKLGLKDGDGVEVTFFGQKKKNKIPGLGLIAKLYGYQPQLQK